MWEITSMRHRTGQYSTSDLRLLGVQGAAYSPSVLDGAKYLAYGLVPWQGRRNASHQFSYVLKDTLQAINEARDEATPLYPAPASWSSTSPRTRGSASVNSSNAKGKDDLDEYDKNHTQYQEYLRRLDPRMSYRERNRTAMWAAQMHVRLFKAGIYEAATPAASGDSSMTEG